MPENQKFKNEGENSQYNQFNESFSKGLLFLNQQIFSAHSKICNVDNTRRDLSEPSLSNTCGGILSVEQLYKCSKMSNALHKSSTPNNYKSMYDGVRSYSCNETGYNLDQDPNVMKYQGLQLSMILKVINVGMSFIKAQILLVIRAFILERKIIIVVNTVKVVISLQNLFRLSKNAANVINVEKLLVNHQV